MSILDDLPDYNKLKREIIDLREKDPLQFHCTLLIDYDSMIGSLLLISRYRAHKSNNPDAKAFYSWFRKFLDKNIIEGSLDNIEDVMSMFHSHNSGKKSNPQVQATLF